MVRQDTPVGELTQYALRRSRTDMTLAAVFCVMVCVSVRATALKGLGKSDPLAFFANYVQSILLVWNQMDKKLMLGIFAVWARNIMLGVHRLGAFARRWPEN